jgi:hypothetical protein
MDASCFPPQPPSKHADYFNEHRLAAAHGTRAAMAHLQERLQRSSSPNLRFAVLTAPVRRGGLSSHAGIKASAPFQRTVAASIGKSTN